MPAKGWCVSGFLKLFLCCVSVYACTCVCVYVCLCVCPLPRLLITSGMMWHKWVPYDWLNKFYHFYMAAVVSIISRCGFRIESHFRIQPNKSKPVMYKPWIHFSSHLKQLQKSNKMEWFSYKGGCDVCGCMCLKEGLARATDRWLWVIKTVLPLRN